MRSSSILWCASAFGCAALVGLFCVLLFKEIDNNQKAIDKLKENYAAIAKPKGAADAPTDPPAKPE